MYLGFLARKDADRQGNSLHTKSLIIPKLKDWTLIKDKLRDIKVGDSIEILINEDKEVNKVKLIITKLMEFTL